MVPATTVTPSMDTSEGDTSNAYLGRVYQALGGTVCKMTVSF